MTVIKSLKEYVDSSANAPELLVGIDFLVDDILEQGDVFQQVFTRICVEYLKVMSRKNDYTVCNKDSVDFAKAILPQLKKRVISLCYFK